MDIIKQLDSKSKAECWQLFTKLSKVFMVLKYPKSEAVEDLKTAADKMNELFIKNGHARYFDTEQGDSLFIESLLSEMKNIRNGKKLDD